MACLNCRFEAVEPYTPAIDVEAILRNGTGDVSPEINLGILDDIPFLEREVSALDTLFQEISDRRDSVKKALESHHAVFSPIRRLPQDTLLEIFANLPTNALVPTDAPWIIGQVCSLWRTISLSTPSLWSHIVLEGYRGLNRDQKLQALTTILSRSQNHPLTICIDSLPFKPDFPDHPSNPISDLSILAAQGSRWSTLELRVNTTDLVNIVDLIDHSNAPLTRLRNLHITAVKAFDDEDDIMYKPVFSSSPLLHCLLRGITASNMQIPLQNLATLTYELAHSGELPQLLEQAPELKALRIIPANAITTIGEYEGPVVIHPGLRCFTIYIAWLQRYTLPKVPVSISGISLPGLLELELVTQDVHDAAGAQFTPQDMHRVDNMLQRSRCVLNILRVYSPLPFPSISPILAAHGQSLTVVHLFVDANNALTLFRNLSVEQDPGTLVPAANVLLPSLRHLTLTEVPLYDAGRGMLRECGTLYQTTLSRIYVQDVQRLSTLKLVLVGATLDGLMSEEPMTSSALLHLVALEQIGQGLNLSFIVNGEDVLQDSTWIGALGAW